MKVIASSLPKSGSKTLINDLGCYFHSCFYLEAKVDRGWGNLSTSTAARRLFFSSPISTILYGHFPFCATLEKTVNKADLVLVGLRPLSQLVFSYKRHIDRTGYSPLDLRIGGFPDISLGWKSKSEIEQLIYILDWLLPYSAKFLLSWLWVRRNFPVKVKFLFYEDVINKNYSEALERQFDLTAFEGPRGFHFGRRSTNFFQNSNDAGPDQRILQGVNEMIQMRRICYFHDFVNEEMLFNYVFD